MILCSPSPGTSWPAHMSSSELSTSATLVSPTTAGEGSCQQQTPASSTSALPLRLCQFLRMQSPALLSPLQKAAKQGLTKGRGEPKEHVRWVSAGKALPS